MPKQLLTTKTQGQGGPTTNELELETFETSGPVVELVDDIEDTQPPPQPTPPKEEDYEPVGQETNRSVAVGIVIDEPSLEMEIKKTPSFIEQKKQTEAEMDKEELKRKKREELRKLKERFGK